MYVKVCKSCVTSQLLVDRESHLLVWALICVYNVG